MNKKIIVFFGFYLENKKSEINNHHPTFAMGCIKNKIMTL